MNAVNNDFRPPEPPGDPLAALLDAMFHGGADPQAVAELDAAMQHDRQLRRRVLGWLHLESCIGWEVTEVTTDGPLPMDGDATIEAAPVPDVAPSPPASAVAAPPADRDHWTRIVATPQFLSLTVAALAVTIIVLSLALFRLPEEGPAPSGPAEPPLVARINDSRAAQWQLLPEQSPPEFIRRGERLELLSGVVELELFGGATAIVEGPAIVSLEDDNTLDIERGTATCRVPPQSSGFRVLTPSVELVDLGTAFGVAVDEAGASDVWMFSGLVHAYPRAATAGGEPIALTAGIGGRFEVGRAEMLASSADATRFVRRLPRGRTQPHRIAAQQDVYRLIDSDRDDQGDKIDGPMPLIIGVGERNTNEPWSDEGRVWIAFEPSEEDVARLERAERVRLVVESPYMGNKQLNLAIEGLVIQGRDLEAAGPPQPSDYHRRGERLGLVAMADVAEQNGYITLDITKYVQRRLAEGRRRFAIRVQVDPPELLPNDDMQRDNVILASGERGQRRPPRLVVSESMQE